MTAPSIEMISVSLRGCSLTTGGGGGSGGGGGEATPGPSSSDSSSPAIPSPPRHLHQSDRLAEASDESAAGVTVDLNSETALPYYWEQRLDLRTGEVYYINWQTGVRTTEDPRTSSAASVVDTVYQSTYCYSADEDDDDYENDDIDTSLDDDSSSDIAGYVGGEYDDSADSSSISTLSTPSPPGAPSTSAERFSDQVLVAAGCKSCFMYFMVPKRVDACPKCGGGGLLHLGRNGCV